MGAVAAVDALVAVKNGEKPLSVAIAELNQAKIKVVGEEEDKQSVTEEAVLS